jgi:phenylalanyl-tRNA synthetase beta chain
MKVSLNSIKWLGYPELFEVPLEQLVDKINGQLGALEEDPVYLGALYDGIIVAKVVACEKHSNADKLSVCLIDDGGVAKDVPRNEQGLVQVVCGAPNVKAGMTVAWLPPGTTVPASVGKDPFVLEAREIRGVVSNGMLASPSELAISDDHSGIIEIKAEDVGEELMKPGTPFKQLYGLDDHVLNIENKMFTHRPDLFGQLGVGREIAGIQHKSFKSPDWYKPDASIAAGSNELQLSLSNELPHEVPRFILVPVGGVEVKTSPVWLQTWLSRLGLRPINNIVDLTNYYMQLTGQPLHAYDYDKVKTLSGSEGANVVVRNPRSGEKITLLNGKEIEPRGEAIVIATDQKLIGLAGVMGGAETEVDSNTKNIILEVGTFDMYSIRRTSMAHGLFTDAVTRFNKGQSPLQNMAVAAKAIGDIAKLAGGKVAGPVLDNNHLDQSVMERASLHVPVTVTVGFINDRLGLKLSTDEIKVLLENVEFQVGIEGENLSVKAPFWRTDIELREDIVEEVGRLYGYDRLPYNLPVRDLTPTRRDPMFDLKAKVRDLLSDAGANELLTYSFVHSDLLSKVCQDKGQAFQISNALSPDLQYYRLSLTPSLLEKVHPNIKAGYDNFALFEIGKAHVSGENDPQEPEVPKEVDSVSFVYASKKTQLGAPYYQAKKYLDYLLNSFKGRVYVGFESLEGADLYKNPWLEQMVAPFEPGRSAVLRDLNGLVWGVVGEYKASVRRSLKLPDYSAGFELDPLLAATNLNMPSYVTLTKFPSVNQDITLKVPTGLAYGELIDEVWNEINKLKPKNSFAYWSPIDIYQKEDDKDHKQVTLRLEIASYDRTLTDAEVAKLLDLVAEVANQKFQADRI